MNLRCAAPASPIRRSPNKGEAFVLLSAVPARQRETDLLAVAQKHASWFLRGGTTTIEAKSGYGLSVEAEMKILRVVQQTGKTTPLRCVPTFLGAHEVPDEFVGRTPAYVDLVVEEMLPLVRPGEAGEFLRRLLRAAHLR